MKKRIKAKEKPEIIRMPKRVAGIDIGSRSHFISVSSDITDDNIREYGVYTADLRSAIDWLKSHKIESR